ncbi:DUF3570 domain-containing protein [Maribacter sp. 2307ULW6-5]|uniref:DUF3570 domain-containing protein n=1 Tax=Maribacter sp. 2307ULW6-5 TaxID=3386275 RepID=UPI0039BCCC3C
MRIGISTIYCLFFFFWGLAQEEGSAPSRYTKRVLETAEVDFLSSYYGQQGDHAAVTGGLGTEELTDVTGSIVVSIPLNDDDVLTIDAGVSAYTSASSSNVNPFDGQGADAFVASSGASANDVYTHFNAVYAHSSQDRNTVWTAHISGAKEYDYASMGFGGVFVRRFNEKNTELSLTARVFLDRWDAIYPIELRPFGTGGVGSFRASEITGNPNYDPDFTAFRNTKRNSYTLGMGLSQILHKKVLSSLSLDLVQQQGLLSTPFQRVYFADVADAFVDGFHLADDVERLPDRRFKVAAGGRLHWFVNEWATLRTFYRFYWDNWGLTAHTAQLEMPIKIGGRFTLYPSYRFYAQTAADYFAGYDQHLSTAAFHTSDFDLSRYLAHQWGMGVGYTDIFTGGRLWKFGLKNIDLKFYKYDRDIAFSSYIVTTGFTFLLD